MSPAGRPAPLDCMGGQVITETLETTGGRDTLEHSSWPITDEPVGGSRALGKRLRCSRIARDLKLSKDSFFSRRCATRGMYSRPRSRAGLCSMRNRRSKRGIVPPRDAVRPGHRTTHPDYIATARDALPPGCEDGTGSEVSRGHRAIEFRRFLDTIERRAAGVGLISFSPTTPPTRPRHRRGSRTAAIPCPLHADERVVV